MAISTSLSVQGCCATGHIDLMACDSQHVLICMHTADNRQNPGADFTNSGGRMALREPPTRMPSPACTACIEPKHANVKDT